MTSPVGQTGMVIVTRDRDGNIRVNCTDVPQADAVWMLTHALEAVEDFDPADDHPPAVTVVLDGVEYEFDYTCDEDD